MPNPYKQAGALLVVGSRGFVGRSVTLALRASGLPVVTGSHEGEADISIDLWENPEKALERLPANVTHALFCSAISNVDLCFREPERTRNFNVTRTSVWISALQQRGLHLIYCSSDFVFRGDVGNYSETDVPNPTTEYGRQKTDVESILMSSNLRYSILRMGKLYSIAADPSSFLHSLLMDLYHGKMIRGATDQALAPVCVDDVARTIGAILDRGLTGLFHIAPAEPMSRYEIARVIAELIGAADLVQPASIDDFAFAELRPKQCWLNGRYTSSRTDVLPIELRRALPQVIAPWRRATRSPQDNRTN